MDMTLAEVFLLAWGLTMTVLWQLSKVRFKKLLVFSYKAAALAADGKGKFVRTDDDTVQFKEM